MYAVYYGEYQGASICYIDEDSKGNTLSFCVMVPLEAIYISKQEFNKALKNKKVELMEQVPKDVYDVISANYYHQKKVKK